MAKDKLVWVGPFKVGEFNEKTKKMELLPRELWEECKPSEDECESEMFVEKIEETPNGINVFFKSRG